MMTNIFSLEGKTAVVIGGTSGIGRILSLGLADAGADVIASGRRREHVDETAKVDILINSAGIIKRMPTLTMPEEEWADILNTNLTGTLRACQIFVHARSRWSGQRRALR